MIEDELIKIWQSSSNPERVKFEKSKLMLELDSSLERFQIWWKNMERVNVISGWVTVLGFIPGIIWVPYTSMKISSVLIMVWAIYIGRRGKSVKKFKPNELEENYLQYLEKTKTYLLAQKRFFETSLNWRVLTILPIYAFFFTGIWDKPLARYVGVISFFGLVGILIYSYYKSKRIVRNKISPRINKVEELIKKLKE
ncbi:hypothetical protein FEE95_19060 [Maribacter algarum]|uniref:Uncharacterized protein n=1 Tax=Maribacter algarum (ex Zhang et al. 2020) TaxID=2578118 RepID=A0A5S3Q8D4_9FLAO|nr:hypothetical protein [Maribacter algarum]TMM53171.1 hypothetical protein FEE95_19060 [Maribacter algarum]